MFKQFIHAFKRIEMGFSLIELMVAMVIGIILLLGITTVVANSSRSYKEITKLSVLLENGRYATTVLADDIGQAGFYGEFYGYKSSGGIGFTLPSALPDPCETTVGNFWSNSNAAAASPLALPIQGYDFDVGSTDTTSLRCIPDHVAGTDILVIRRASTVPVPEDADSNTPTSLPTLDSNRIYLQSSASGMRVSKGDSTAATNFGLPPPPNTNTGSGVWRITQNDTPTKIPGLIRPLEVHIYFIRDLNGIPTLCRAELTSSTLTDDPSDSGPVINIVPIAQGVENLQIEYGMDYSGDGSLDNGSGSDAVYVKDPGSVSGWSDVMTVRVYMLARSIEPSFGYDGTGRVYQLGVADDDKVTITSHDPPKSGKPYIGDYKRHVFSTVMRLVNISGRRESRL